MIVGDDPGSHAYVRGKHNDCAKVGIASIRRDLPATTTSDELFAVIDELNADPACTGYRCSCRCRRGSTAVRARSDDPAGMPTACTR